jgi:hypothetical protein
MKIAASIAITALLCCAVRAEDVAWDKLRDAANRYLEACVPAKEVQSMNKKLKQRVEQRMNDNDGALEDNIMRDLMLDWAFANETRIKNNDREAVKQACLYFVIFHDKGFSMPAQIRDQLTPDAVKDILEYLEEQIANGKSAKGDKDKKKKE